MVDGGNKLFVVHQSYLFFHKLAHFSELNIMNLRPFYLLALLNVCSNLAASTGMLRSLGRSLGPKKGKETGQEGGRVFLSAKTDALCKKNVGTIFKEEICPILLQLESVFMRKKHLIVPSDIGTLRGVLTGIGTDDPTMVATAVKILGNDEEESKEIGLDEFNLNGFAGYINPTVGKDDGVFGVSNPMRKKTPSLANLLSSSVEILDKYVKNSAQAHRALSSLIILAMSYYPGFYSRTYIRNKAFESLIHPLHFECLVDNKLASVLNDVVLKTKATTEPNSFSSGTLMVIMFLSSICENTDPPSTPELKELAKKLISSAAASSSGPEDLSDVKKNEMTIYALIAEAEIGVDATIKRLNEIL